MTGNPIKPPTTLHYSQRGLLRSAPPWARPGWRAHRPPNSSSRGRTAAGWRSCRWRRWAAGPGPPRERTAPYNTWFHSLVSVAHCFPVHFLCAHCEVSRRPPKVRQKSVVETGGREEEGGRGRPWTDSSTLLTVKVKHEQSQFEQGGEREQRPSIGVVDSNLISDVCVVSLDSDREDKPECEDRSFSQQKRTNTGSKGERVKTWLLRFSF